MIKQALAHQERLTGDPLMATIKRYFIFITGGFVGWLIIIGMQAVFLASLGEIFSYWVGLLFADIFTFVYHRLITFKIKSNWKIRFVKFVIIVTAITLANGAFFSLTAASFDLAKLNLSIIFLEQTLMIPGRIIASFFITFVLSVINFGINRIFIFRHH
ncbi:hypothetical protein CMO88_01025 [Candidatus Woesearchaeota archaeon]|nr:hypothetical protein [Candidatus Woesearchaeota archaeon]|tara:strand:+ start:1304 stop:1780 length:477 start_codon:yes stop_codon:yes gene_type:complete